MADLSADCRNPQCRSVYDTPDGDAETGAAWLPGDRGREKGKNSEVSVHPLYERGIA